MKTLAELKQMPLIPHHDCGCCGAIVGWYPQEPNPFFDPSCDCGGGGGHFETWETVFKWYNSVFENESDDAVQMAWQKECQGIDENTRDKYATAAANQHCRCFKCDGIRRDTGEKCGPKPCNTCPAWYDGYWTARLALEMYGKDKEAK